MAVNVKTMDAGYRGSPYVDVPAKASIVPTTMDIGFRGCPFVCFGTISTSGGAASYILNMCGVARASIAKVATVAIDSAGYIAGVDNVV